MYNLYIVVGFVGGNREQKMHSAKQLFWTFSSSSNYSEVSKPYKMRPTIQKSPQQNIWYSKLYWYFSKIFYTASFEVLRINLELKNWQKRFWGKILRVPAPWKVKKILPFFSLKYLCMHKVLKNMLAFSNDSYFAAQTFELSAFFF